VKRPRPELVFTGFYMLSEEQNSTLKALINAIIPPDDDPGGWDAGVGDYLRRQFERDLKHLVGVYEQGLDSVSAEAKAVNGKNFADLTPNKQEALLAKIEQGRVQTSWQVDPASFFAMAAEHCAEGFYSDPGNGGNRNSAAWKMIGFEVTG
jgi:hypothetical protein